MKYTLKEWEEEAIKRFGEDISNWKFECPACGHINTGEEFKKFNINLDEMYSNCIGRYIGKGSPTKGDTTGCNWAAYGLLGVLGKVDIVIKKDKREMKVFKFAKEDK